jgi:hypothetical protein
MLRAFVLGAMGLFAVSAHALNGEELYHYCESSACGGYFIGAFDALRIASAVGGSQQRRALEFCPPESVEDERIVEVALDYLQRHPGTRHLQAANLTLRAWREQWPCR